MAIGSDQEEDFTSSSMNQYLATVSVNVHVYICNYCNVLMYVCMYVYNLSIKNRNFHDLKEMNTNCCFVCIFFVELVAVITKEYKLTP